MFTITDHIEFDEKGRATCPSCLEGGKTGKNLSIVPGSNAYKCFRGCTTDQIRDAIDQPKDRQIPASLAKSIPPASITITPQRIREANQQLINSKEPLQWLSDRGISIEID
jgi:hypothetical protein